MGGAAEFLVLPDPAGTAGGAADLLHLPDLVAASIGTGEAAATAPDGRGGPDGLSGPDGFPLVFLFY